MGKRLLLTINLIHDSSSTDPGLYIYIYIYPVRPLPHTKYSKELFAFGMDGPIEVAPTRIHVSWFVFWQDKWNEETRGKKHMSKQ